jgi:tripartite-type tricarboxylate transporter receptor subunit TctC
MRSLKLVSRKRAAALVAVAALVLAACGGAEDDTTEDGGDDAAEEPADEGGDEADEDDAGEDDGGEEATGYPEQEVVIHVSHSAGGSSDAIVRAAQPFLQEELGVPIVVENLPGAGGMVASNETYNAPADGYTIQNMNVPSFVLDDLFGENAPPFEEFEYIYRIVGGDTNAIAVRADSEIETWDDLLALAEEREITNAATSGLSNSTLGSAMVYEYAGLEFNRIPYESGGEAVQAVIGGVVDLTVTALASLRGPVEAGELRVLVHFGDRDFEGFEDVQRFSEIYPGAEFTTDTGFIAPPGTPDEVIEVFRAAFDNIAADPEFIETLSQVATPDPLSGDEWETQIADLTSTLLELEDAIQAVTITE